MESLRQSTRPTPRASRPRAERASKKPAETAGSFVPLWWLLSGPLGQSSSRSQPRRHPPSPPS
jgi:hypothetical protein